MLFVFSDVLSWLDMARGIGGDSWGGFDIVGIWLLGTAGTTAMDEMCMM